jgi:ADP-heptose:LPS heptosyltransferase
MSDYKKTYTLPFKFGIPNYSQAFLEETSAFKRLLKYIKRYFYILLRRQNKHEVFNILPSHNRILWINLSAPSLGDSLMDLSSRVMLKDKNIDLFTDKKNAILYDDDQVFANVYTKKEAVGSSKYDLVIIDSYSTRSINIKSNLASTTPYIGMFGYYNGPEVNRVLFSFHQMNHLLGYIKSEVDINSSSKVSLCISNQDKEIVKNIGLPAEYIMIALGGEWKYRTYNKWDCVIEKLISKDNNINIILIGSDNAKDSAKVIFDKFSDYNIINCVAKFTFNQTSQIIKQAQILLCCDGGLMHSANAVNTPIVALFARLTTQMQLTESICAFSLYDKNNVNNITVENVINKYNEAVNSVFNHPLIE